MNKRILILFTIFSLLFGLILCACTYTITTKSIYDINLSIEKNDIDYVKKAIENVNLNTVYYNESCDDGEEDDGEWYACLAPLETATMFNRYEIAKLLIDNGADVNYKDKYVHYTPLSILFRYNNDFNEDTYKIVSLLIDKGANINVRDNDKVETPIEELCNIHLKNEKQEQISVKILKLFLKNGVPLETDNYDYPLLVLAAGSGNLEMVKYLVEEEKLDVNVMSKNGSTSLIATTRTSFDAYKVAEYLVLKGANTDIKDNFGKTALDYAKSNGKDNIVNLLKSYK